MSVEEWVVLAERERLAALVIPRGLQVQLEGISYPMYSMPFLPPMDQVPLFGAYCTELSESSTIIGVIVVLAEKDVVIDFTWS